MQEFFTAISNFGFPVVVAGYLLFRFENKMEKLNDSIAGKDGLVSQIQKLTEVVNQNTASTNLLIEKISQLRRR